MKTLKRKLGRVYTNLKGWKTKRKIVVIESDDWGSIRMPSREVYEKCLKAGYPVDKISFERYDSILSEEDLEKLFDLLASYKDKNGNHPLITANCMVTNPDFDKIKESDFKEYHYELITETFKRSESHKNCFELWKKGMEMKVIHPQSHGREHLNVSQFMTALQKNDKDAHFGFSNGMPGCISLANSASGNGGNTYVMAMRYNSLQDKEDKLNIFLEGLDLFEQLFGFKSESIIPPNFIWSPDYNEAVAKKGVKYIQGIRTMFEPIEENKYKHHGLYMGQKNKHGQVYNVRNVIYEPSMFMLGIDDPVYQCLAEMDIAFKMRKPAVITTHRINFSGFVDPENRDKNLSMLNKILSKALKRWPDIEFMTSDQLGRLMDVN